MTKTNNIVIGVLAVQGSFAEHTKMLNQIGVKAVQVKSSLDLERIDGLIIPGGESTVISKLMKRYQLTKQIVILAKKGLPIYGTCAGAILLVKKIRGKVVPESLSLMNIEIERNAYGSQLDSFQTDIPVNLSGEKRTIPAIFIRAPIIGKVGKGVNILAKLQNGQVVLAKEKNFLISTFHPELTEDETVHRYFISMCGEKIAHG